MNVLLSMPDDRQSNNYLINAFQDLGHKVVFLDHRARLEDCYKYVAEVIKVEKIDLMLVLYLNEGKTYSSDFIQTLQGKFPNVKYCAWNFDAVLDGVPCPENEYLIDLAKIYDYFFTVSKDYVEEMKKQGINAFLAKEGCDIHSCNFFKEKDFKYDVSFIGQFGHPSVHIERVPLLKKIIENFDNTVLYGQCYTGDKDIFSHYVGRPTYNDVEHERIVSQTKINIGHSWYPELREYFSARNYRVMGQGGFLLANYCKDMENVFEIGKEMDVYHNPKECIEKIDYYLKNEEERETIAKAGKERVLKDYTFKNSILSILEVVK